MLPPHLRSPPPGAAVAARSSASGRGLDFARPGEVGRFAVHARTRSGAPRQTGGDPFQASAVLWAGRSHMSSIGGSSGGLELDVPSVQTGLPVETAVRDLGNGSYTVSYSVPDRALGAAGSAAAELLLAVRLRGAHINGSPFAVPLRRTQRALRGQLVRSFGGAGADAGRLLGPRGLCVSAGGEIGSSISGLLATPPQRLC
jgi:hypothetical protein